MHELSVATALYEACLAERPRGAGRILRVEIAVGELAAVEPRLLESAWQALVGGGPDEGAALSIEWQPARQTCERCGTIDERQAGSWLRLCPGCGGALLVEGGDALDLLRIEFAEEVAA